MSNGIVDELTETHYPSEKTSEPNGPVEKVHFVKGINFVRAFWFVV